MQPRLWPSWTGIVLALMCLTTMPACGVRQLARGEIQPPKVSFQGLKIYKPTARGWPLGAMLLLENPNAEPLNLRGYDYQLWIEDRSVAQGVSQEAVNLPPLGQTVTEVPITVKLSAIMELWPQFLPMLQKSQQQRQFRYQIAGSFRLASVMGGIIPIPFKFQGESTLREGMNFLQPYLR
jgi:LEA14-like dessication related protein